MKYKSCASAVAAVLMASAHVGAASAQDVPAYDWSGFYVGAHAGMAGGDTDASASVFGDFCIFFSCTPFSTTESVNGDVRGMIGGVAIGYNYQWGGVVFGVEADINASEATSAPSAIISETILGQPFEIGTFSTSLDWYGTLRGRLGYDLAGGLMVYGTGGLAYGRVLNSIGYNIANALTDSFSSSETRTGWTAGAGMEMALFNTDRLRLKAEYLYTDLGGDEFFRDGTGSFGSTFLGSNGINATSSADLTFHTVRVGVNFAF
jgi:outer membrane immunogenic protein